MKILVADDSKTNLLLITSALEKLGHTVIPVNSGEKAIEVFQKNPPDLVILDVIMEGINGFECATRLRTLSQSDTWIPIIFLSANVDDESIKQGIDAGGDDYLTKPFSDVKLAAKIKAMQRIADMRNKLVDTTHRLELLSSTDALTGVNNRFQFDKSIVEKLHNGEHENRMMALMFIDIDNFKLINDTFGHHIGDLLLKEVIKRLRGTLRTEDFIARIGGDEFSIIINAIESIDSIDLIAQKILDSLAPDFFIEGHYIRSTVSIGIACYPYPGTTTENIVKHADVAMYHAKSLGKNNYQYFSDDLNKKYIMQSSLEYEIKFALDRNEITLTYQPIYNIKENTICGFETLACWTHPKHGSISPATFIPIAEETGLIVSIGNWILQTACKQANKWPIKNLKNCKFAINLSLQQLVQKNFIQMLQDILNQNNIPADLLEFDISEKSVMNYQSEIILKAIQSLHQMGISIAIDDFGTGYSSLTRLINLAIDTVKIDKLFIQDVTNNTNSAAIVTSLIGLGKNLNLKVIAKGIETQEQLQFLRQNGCTYGQGFLLGKPVSAEKLVLDLEKIQQESIHERK